MSLRRPIAALLLSGCVLAPISALALPTKNVAAEVNYLLNAIGTSRCEFYRNGSWYSPVAARTHLREKYLYLAARNLINTTEEFIEKAATKSSFSGLAYAVKCGGLAEVSSKLWLGEVLAQSRMIE